MRAALLSWFFSAIEIMALLTPPGQGIVHGYISRYIIMITATLFLNTVISGTPKITFGKRIPDVEGVEYFSSNSLSTLLFLLQGYRNKGIERNIVLLSGLKKVYLSPNEKQLHIENAGPLTKTGYLETIYFLIIGLTLLFVAPIGLVALEGYIAKMLFRLGIPGNFSANLLWDLSVTVLVFYFFVPYIVTSYKYLNSSVTIFSKRIEGVGRNSVYESPIMPFLQTNRIGPLGMAASNDRVFVNPLIAKNKWILNYIIAHEEGHITDRFGHIMRHLLSPIIFPCLIYIIVIILDYLHYIGIFHYTYEFIFLVCAGIGLLLLIFREIKERCESRADDFAVRKMGTESVISALQQLAYGGNVLLDEYRSTAIKRIERIKEKCGRS